ncbi:MAG: hypothetical protein GZ093_05130 [Rhodoferax sp.]|uniref:hypothetical protein n=1 Tax=Rhodoferax sp. TaxID=50421 RepID=UPI0014004F15|nr:hypothetical protein [Rhodoferax sp.]NDP38119.1 hypothetical protein [Rhodoferax sp.]
MIETVSLNELLACDRRLAPHASDVTRPSGLRGAQIEIFKTVRWRALTLLDPLCADRSRYVQNVVDSRLNDASKTRAKWVSQPCERWLVESDAPRPAALCAGLCGRYKK